MPADEERQQPVVLRAVLDVVGAGQRGHLGKTYAEAPLCHQPKEPSVPVLPRGHHLRGVCPTDGQLVRTWREDRLPTWNPHTRESEPIPGNGDGENHLPRPSVVNACQERDLQFLPHLRLDGGGHLDVQRQVRQGLQPPVRPIL